MATQIGELSEDTLEDILNPLSLSCSLREIHIRLKQIHSSPSSLFSTLLALLLLLHPRKQCIYLILLLCLSLRLRVLASRPSLIPFLGHILACSSGQSRPLPFRSILLLLMRKVVLDTDDLFLPFVRPPNEELKVKLFSEEAAIRRVGKGRRVGRERSGDLFLHDIS